MLPTDRILAETFVRRVECHAELGSTNDRAAELAREDVEPPLLIVAQRQTAGRGRGRNGWWSSAGALTFSLLHDLPDSIGSHERPKVALAAGLAVCEALSAWLPASRIGLKWPNDVLIDGHRKICGILVEAPGRAGRTVIGVGLNVNNVLAAAPDEVRRRATSLIDCGAVAELGDVLIRLLQELDAALVLLNADAEELHARWNRFDLLSGRTVTLHAGAQSLAGRCTGIDPSGALLLTDGQTQRRCYSGTVVNWV